MLKAVSLFANVGIAETYFKEIGIDVIIANELLPERAKFYSHLYPDTNMIVGDIADLKIYNKIVDESKDKKIDLLLATPPCQGMSVAGSRNPYDERNSLIKYAVDYALDIKPRYIFFENVVQQLKTPIEYNGKMMKIPEYIEKRLGNDYYINEDKIINAMDYGVAQNRKRAIFLLTRKDQKVKWKFPVKDKKIITLEEAIGDLSSLNPKIREKNFRDKLPISNCFKKVHKWHKPPTHAWRHIECMMHTPTGQSAWDNKEFFPKKADGMPSKGYHTTYHRMDWKKPAPTVTKYNGVIGSQMNVHPGRKNPDGTYSDPRVLTIYELMIITSLPSNWNIPEWASETLIRYAIGEGIPPLMVKKIMNEITKECDIK